MLVSKPLIIEIILVLKLSLLDFIKLANMQRCTLGNPHVYLSINASSLL